MNIADKCSYSTKALKWFLRTLFPRIFRVMPFLLKAPLLWKGRKISLKYDLNSTMATTPEKLAWSLHCRRCFLRVCFHRRAVENKIGRLNSFLWAVQTFIADMTAPIKLGPEHKNKDITGKGWSADQFSESYTKVSRSAINYDYYKVLYSRWAEQTSLARSLYNTL